MTSKMASRSGLLIVIAALAPMTMGAEECTSTDPAAEMSGQWAVDYDDTLRVQIGIGGAVYDEVISAAGGTITLEHEGRPIVFELDCARPDVVCPSEVWPDSVELQQRNPTYPSRVWVRIPTQTCMGTQRAPSPAECGPGTLNPDCEMVCDGEVAVGYADRFGLLRDDSSRFEVLLGAGVATNGINCALLGVSAANADVVTSGAPMSSAWRGEGMENGEISVGYAGGCLWAGDPDMDGELEALVLSASVKFTTGFTATRAD